MFSTDAQIYQFRGPDRDGKFPESDLLKEWPEGGHQLLLEFEGIGEGYSSVISNGKYIYVSGKIEDMDHLTCIDFEGNQLWQVAYGRSWNQGTPNTRSTPIIEDDRIYIISGMGELVCLNAETGKINWKINVDEDYQTEWHKWGVAESPLIVVKDNMIFLSIGYNYPAKMLKVNDEVSALEEVYTNDLLDNHHHGLIEHVR